MWFEREEASLGGGFDWGSFILFSRTDLRGALWEKGERNDGFEGS